MLRHPFLRTLLALALGACAGLSFASGILPLALQIAGVGEQAYLARVLLSWVAPTALVWAVGGWSVLRLGNPLAGAGVMAATGLASGLLLVGFGLVAEPRLLAAGAVGGLLYGGLAGMILGRITTPVNDDEEAVRP